MQGILKIGNEKTYLKLAERSRNAYLFRPATLTRASSFRRTIRSQITTSFLTYGNIQKKNSYISTKGKSDIIAAAWMEARNEGPDPLLSPHSKSAWQQNEGYTYAICVLIFSFKIQEKLLCIPIKQGCQVFGEKRSPENQQCMDIDWGNESNAGSDQNTIWMRHAWIKDVPALTLKSTNAYCCVRRG